MTEHIIRVETNDSEFPHQWNVYLNGVDITSIISGITIEGLVGKHAKVRLDCLAKVELVGALKARVEIVEAG